MTIKEHDEFLVTGATGFVGGEMVRLLRSMNITTRILVRTPEKAAELAALGAEVVLGDLRDKDSIRRAVQGVAGVFHIGALYRETNFPEEVFFDINAEGTRRVLDASIEAGVERVVHCSTGGVLGDIKDPPGNEHTPYAPDDMYQRSKTEGEKIALSYFREGKISGCVIRPGMIYGIRDTRFLRIFRAIKRRRFIHIGDGSQWVHYLDVRDLVNAFYLAMQHHERNGGIYTIAGERPVSFREFVNTIADVLGVSRPWLKIPLLPIQLAAIATETVCTPLGISPPLYRRRVDFFKKNRYFDISKARAELGYSPAQSLVGEIKDTLSWYQSAGWL